MAARAPCTFLHRSSMHACPASLDRLRVFPARELRPSPGSAIFSLREANALTHGVMGGAHRLCWACRVVWTEKRQGRATVRQGCADGRGAQPPRWPLMTHADTMWAVPAARHQGHPQRQDRLLCRGSVRNGAHRGHESASRRVDHGVADACHRCPQAPVVTPGPHLEGVT
jgi:hypothetical protein